MNYTVTKKGAKWALIAETGTKIGELTTRKEALAIGRALAGWRGTVTTRKAG